MLSFPPMSRRESQAARRPRGSHAPDSRASRRIEAAIEPLERRFLLAADVPAPLLNFQFPTQYLLPDRPFHSVFLQDINGDGHPDLVFLGGTGVNVMLGDGNGGFQKRGTAGNYYYSQVFPVAPTGGGIVFNDMVLADLNGDGIQDAIVVESPYPSSAKTGTVSVLLGNADGTFQRFKSYSVGPGAAGVAVGDFNGYADIVVANTYNRTAQILFQNGDGSGKGAGTFSPNYETLAVGNGATSVVVADINGDGQPDIVVGNIYYNPTTKTDGPVSYYRNPTTGYGSKVYGTLSILLNNSDANHPATVLNPATFQPQRVQPFSLPYNLQVTNFQGDTFANQQLRPDIVGNGGVLFDESYAGAPLQFKFVAGGTGQPLTKIDVNGDGNDFVSVNYNTNTTHVVLGQYSGRFYSEGSTYSTTSRAITYNTDANGNRVIATNQVLGYGPQAGIAGDLNGDGIPDLVILDYGVVANRRNGVNPGQNPPPASITVFLDQNKTNLKFAGQTVNTVGIGVNPTGTPPAKSPGTNSYPHTMVVTDLNGDGRPDIVEISPGTAPKKNNGNAPTYSNYPGTLSILLNEGNGVFFTLETITDRNVPTSVAVADVNGDGKPDILVTDQYNYIAGAAPALDIFLGQDGGYVSPAPIKLSLSNIANRPVAIAVGDLNGDGTPDVVVDSYGVPYANAKNPGTPGILSILLNSGGGNFSAPTSIFDAYGPTDVYIHDFNGDGNQDIVVTSKLSHIEGTYNYGDVGRPNSITFLEGDGAGGIANGGPAHITLKPPSYAVGAGPSQILAGYFDGYTNATTGNPNPIDLAILNQTSDSLTLLRTNSDGTFQIQQVYNFPFAQNANRDSAPIYLATGLTTLDSNGDPTTQAADINGDHLPDIVVDYAGVSKYYRNANTALYHGPGVAAFINPGASGGYYFGNPIPLTVSATQIDQTLPFPAAGVRPTFADVRSVPTEVVIADLNGDNHPDMVVLEANHGPKSSYAARVTVLLQGSPVSGPVFTNSLGSRSKTVVVGTLVGITIGTIATPSATITEAGALPSGITFTTQVLTNGRVNAILSGTPNPGSGGVYIITLTADNGFIPAVPGSNIEVYTLTVDQVPAFITATTTNFAVGISGSFTIRATGYPIGPIGFGNSQALTLTEFGALDGLSFRDAGSGIGTISGTPTAGGIFVVDVVAQNRVNGVLRTVSDFITITVVQPAMITSAASALFSGTAGFFQITATGVPTPTLSESGVPSGINFFDNGDGTGALTGIPLAGGGSYHFTITASSAGSAPFVQNFTLSVVQSPAITSANHATFAVGTTSTFTVATTGTPVSTISETGEPAGITFHDNGNGTATLTGAFAPGANGVFVFTLNATNGVAPDAAQTFTATVNQSAAITSTNKATFAVGTAGTFSITTTGFPTAAVSESGSLPGGVTFHDNGNGTATLSGTPAAGSGGIFHFSLSANNGAPVTQAFTLTVGQTPAITSANTVGFKTSQAGSFTVTTTGFPTAALSESGSLPSGVTFHDNGNGTATIAGTPAPGSTGAFNLTINAVNGVGAGASQAFTIAINAPPSVTNVSGTLLVIGTLSADNIAITQSNGTVFVNVDNLINPSFPLNTVQAVDVVTLSGDDSTSIGAGVPTAVVSGTTGNDTIVASNSAPDTLTAGTGNSSLRGGTGTELLQGNIGNDTIIAGSGNQTLAGAAGADSIFGGLGSDFLKGGNGPDTLISGGGHNTLNGGKGHDSLTGGSGFNLMDGGPGTDTLLVGPGDTVVPDPLDTILHS